MLCCICNDEINVESNGWAQGHNAEPVVPNGRCCKLCNHTHVIPARLSREHMGSISESGKYDTMKSAIKDDEERKQAARDGASASMGDGKKMHVGDAGYIGDVLNNMIRELKDAEIMDKQKSESSSAKESAFTHKRAPKKKKVKRKAFNAKWRDKNR